MRRRSIARAPIAFASLLAGLVWLPLAAQSGPRSDEPPPPVLQLLSHEPPTGDTGQPVAMYKLEDAWFGENRDEISLQNDFGLIKADPAQQGYDVRSTTDLSAGIPATTRIIILPGNGFGIPEQTDDINDPTAQANLTAFVEGGGCLLANLGDNLFGDGYLVPGLSGKADDLLSCSGTTITAAGLGHPITLGPDGAAGGGDDLTQDSVDASKAGFYGGSSFCYDNHGSLDGILPADATVIWTEEGDLQRATLAEYSLGAGRVVVHTRPIEFGADAPQVMVNVLNNILDLEGCGNRDPVCDDALASPAELWPPDHSFRDVQVLGVTDPDEDPVTVTITSIFQDEPVFAIGQGNTAPDGAGVGTATASVRAERSGTPRLPGDGRVYTIGFTAEDGKGGACQGSVKVCVPHDQANGISCVDGGASFDSTSVGCGIGFELALVLPPLLWLYRRRGRAMR